MTVIEKLDMNIKQANSDFVAIKNKIVEKGVEVADGTRTAEYASKIDNVYESGKQAQYDEFWDNYLADAKATGFGAYLFGGRGWNADTFNPPYKIDFLTNGYGLFAYAGNIPKDKIALVDFSKINTNFHGVFNYSQIKELPRISTIGTNEIGALLNSAKTETVDTLVLKEDGSQNFTNTFVSANSLENIVFEGTIGQNGLNLQWSTKLTQDSITSIIEALSTTTSGLSITLSKTAVDNAFREYYGENHPNNVEGSLSHAWNDVIATKSNWTINLI